MRRIGEWIGRHQVLTFFILAYAISWPLLLLYYYVIFPVDPGLGILLEPLIAFSPALVAMLVSGIAVPRPKHESSRPRWTAFGLAWIASCPVLILYGVKIYEMDLVAAVIAYSIIALFPAWVLSGGYARTPGVRRQFTTLLKPRGPVLWYLVVFLICPGIQILSIGISRLFQHEAQFRLADLGLGSAVVFLLLEFTKGFLLTGGINEESGWRGFALPRLQARYPVIVAAVIVWFFWAFWHLPYDIGRGTSFSAILENRLLWNLSSSIIMTWLYNRTNGSILAPALFHSAMNTFGSQFSVTAIERAVRIGLTVFAIISDRMWKKLPEDSLAVYRPDDPLA